MSLRGPRPQRSPLATSSHSITPLAPRVMVTRPSDPCAADGMKIPSVRLRAACTSGRRTIRSEEHTSELQSPCNLVCRLLLEKKKNNESANAYLNHYTRLGSTHD